MTGDILKRYVIVELQDPEGSSTRTEKSSLFRILRIYEKYYKNKFMLTG